MSGVHPRVKAAATGGTVAGAASVVLVWLLGASGLEVPPEVASALTTLMAGAFAFVAGYRRTVAP